MKTIKKRIYITQERRQPILVGWIGPSDMETHGKRDCTSLNCGQGVCTH